MRLGVVLLWATSLALVVTNGMADDAAQKRAGAAFKRGSAAYARRDFAEAAAAFEEANEILAAGASLYNAALAWQSAGDIVKAANDFSAALALGTLEPWQRDEATKRLAALARELGIVTARGPAGSSVWIDDARPTPDSTRRYVLPGDHVARAKLGDGSEVSRAVTVAAGGAAEITLEAPAREAPPVPPVPDRPAADHTLRNVSLAIGGTGVVTVGVGIVLGAVALKGRDDFVAKGRMDASLRDQVVTMQAAANVTLVVAGVLGVTSLVLFTVSSVRHTARTDVATLRLSPAGIWLDFRLQ
jgi:hypothetical protein